MANINYFSGIVKILETPKNYSLDSEVQVTKFRVEVSQRRKNRIIWVLIWGNLGRDVQKFYKQKDYILVEGYTSLRPKQSSQLALKTSKQVFLTIVKIYPILLNPDRTSPSI